MLIFIFFVTKHDNTSTKTPLSESPASLCRRTFAVDQRVDRALVATILALDPAFHSHSFPLWAEIVADLVNHSRSVLDFRIVMFYDNLILPHCKCPFNWPMRPDAASAMGAAPPLPFLWLAEPNNFGCLNPPPIGLYNRCLDDLFSTFIISDYPWITPHHCLCCCWKSN